MQIEVLAYPPASGGNFTDKTVIVIDVLRATSTIVTALGNQALEIIPVVEPSEVAELVRNIGPRECLTGGERKGLKIEGFDLGNSPTEYHEEKVRGKKIILCTTNGTKAIKWAQGAAEVLIGSFLNLQLVVEHIQDKNQDLIIVCSGRDQGVCLEDLVCAGMIIKQLDLNNLSDLSDSAKIAYFVYEKAGKKLEQFIKQTQHGRYLTEIGMESDIKECLNLNKYPILPKYIKGKISINS